MNGNMIHTRSHTIARE